MKASSAWSRWFILATLWAVMLVWAFARVEVNWPWYGLYPMTDPDTLLYLRWLEASLLQGKLLATDLYASFPQPFEIQLAPLYREFLYRSSLIFHLLFPSSAMSSESFLGIFPPLSGVLVQILFLISLVLRKAPFALVLCTAFAAIPGTSHFMAFDYMQLDHHWLEVSCIAVWLILADWYYDNQTSLAKVLGGLVIAVFIGVWTGSPQFAAVIVGLLLAQWVLGIGNIPALFEYYSSTMIIGAGIAGIYLARFSRLTADTPFSGVGWVQPALIALAGIIILALLRAKKYWPQKILGRMFVILTVACAGLGFIYCLTPKSLEMAGNFFVKRSRVIQSIGEMISVLDVRQLAGIHGQLSTHLAYWGIFPLFLPLPIIWMFDRRTPKTGRLFVIFGLAAYALTMHQIRFSRWLAPELPFLTGIIFYYVFNILRAGLGPANHVAVCAVLFPFMLFQIGIDFSVAKVARSVSKTTMQALTWLRDRTPETSGYTDDKEPEYGVVSFWDQGNAIAYFARRPVSGGNMLRGFSRFVRVFFAKDETEAYLYCRDKKYRYLYLTVLPGDEEYFRYLKGVADENEDAVDFDLRGDGALGNADETWKSLYFWLYGSLGLKKFGPDCSVTRHFRIVYLSNEAMRGNDSSIKIAEVVPGATVVGRADPHTAVRLNLPIQFGKVVMPYTRDVKANASGAFEMTVPYPTKWFSGGVRTDERCSVNFTASGVAKIIHVDIPEGAVSEGRNVVIP